MREHSQSGYLSRRSLLRGGAALAGLAGAGALSGCAPGIGGSDAPVSFWHLLGGPDGAQMDTFIRDFNSGSDRDVNSTILAWGSPYYTKLSMASAGGRSPDLAVMHAARIPGYAPGGLLNNWDADLFADLGITEADFPELIWEKNLYDGELVAMALDAHPFVMYYNTEIAEAAGVLNSDGQLPETSDPDEFRELAAELSDASPSGTAIAYGYLGDGSNMWRLFYTYYVQMGGVIELPIGGQMQYDEGLVVDTLEWMLSLIDGEIGHSSHDGGTAIAEFATGNAAIFFGGVWETANYQNQGVPFDMSMMPAVFGDPVAYCDSHSLVLPHQDNPDPGARQAAHEFVAYILKNSRDWALAGHIPSYLPVTENPDYAELIPQAHYAAAQDYLLYDPEAWFTGSGSDFSNFFGEYIQTVLMRRTEPIVGWNGFRDRINTILQRPSPVA